jgi:hypothetical protein
MAKEQYINMTPRRRILGEFTKSGGLTMTIQDKMTVLNNFNNPANKIKHLS